MKHKFSTQPSDTIGMPVVSIDKTSSDARHEKVKEDAWQSLDLGGQAFKEHNYEQQNAMTTLNGLVVHGAACASLLALGNMAAVGLASSSEILMAKAITAIPEAGFIGHWPTAVGLPEFINQKVAKAIVEEYVFRSTELVNGELNESFATNKEPSEELKVDKAAEITTRYQVAMTSEKSLEIHLVSQNSVESDNRFTFEIKNKVGQSAVDSASQDNQPIFTGKTEQESLIEILNQDGRVLATTSADNSGYWSIELPYTLPEGLHTFTLYSISAKGERKLIADNVQVEIVAQHEIIEAQGLPSLTLLPMIESDEIFNMMLQDFKQPEPSPAQTLDFGLSELLVMSEADIFSVLHDIEPVMETELTGLENLLHPEGGITMWIESVDTALEYTSATGTNIDLDSLLSNPLDNDL